MRSGSTRRHRPSAGRLSVGVAGDELMVRVGKENHEEALAEPHVRPFDMTGRPMTGWILVGAEGVASGDNLARWVDTGVAYAESLPPN